jgi:RNase P subunit RPR2
MTSTISIYGQPHVVWTCKTCGVVATCPADLYEQRRKSGGFNSCPSGHQWGWPKEDSEDEKIRLERDRLKQQLAQKDDAIRYQRTQREAAEKLASVRKGQVTRLKNRAAAGVCPCCNRTVSQMAKHMQSKHPGFKAEEVS